MGARFDGWTETFDLSRWLRAFELCGLRPEDFTRQREEEEPLPWDHIDVGVTKAFLLRERRRAYEGRTSSGCPRGEAFSEGALCAGCGLGCLPHQGAAS